MLLIASTLLIYELKKKTRNLQVSRHRQESDRALNRTVLVEAVLFVSMTAPAAIATSFLNSYLQTSGEIGNLIILSCNTITFSYHAFNFFIIFWANKRFSREVKTFFSIKNVSNGSTTRTTDQRPTTQNLK